MSEGVVRRNVDARIVSYAMALSSEEPSREYQITMQGCAAAALQAASGIVALAIACRTAATSSPVLDKFEGAGQREKFRTLMEGMSASLDEAWVGELKELFEIVVVLAAESAETDDEQRFRRWAQGLFLDTRPMMIGDASEVKASVEPGEEDDTRRKRVRKPRSSKDVYQQERYENLVTKAIAMGVTETRPVLAGGQVMVVGMTPSGAKRLIKLRGSMAEAKLICERANEEMRKFRVGEAFP